MPAPRLGFMEVEGEQLLGRAAYFGSVGTARSDCADYFLDDKIHDFRTHNLDFVLCLKKNSSFDLSLDMQIRKCLEEI